MFRLYSGVFLIGSFLLFSRSIETEITVILPVENQSNNTVCDIPNQDGQGICVTISECDEYKRIRRDIDLQPENVNFLKRVQCLGLVGPKVCCPSDKSFYKNPTIPFDVNRSATLNNDSFNLRPSAKEYRLSKKQSNFKISSFHRRDDCGKQVNRLYGGEIAELDEYPWMALLIYNLSDFGCGGALINKRFVLTAAHCVTGPAYFEMGGLKDVRLGEYNTKTTIDCIQEFNGLDCADMAIDVRYEKIIVHPSYDPFSKNKEHDIALIKLTKNIKSTQYIKSICLPSINHSNPLHPGMMLSVAGWGRTDLFNKYRVNIPSPIKLKLEIPLVSQENCSQILEPFNIELGPNQICAGGEQLKDTCLGDSGSPLMYFDHELHRWVTYGIVSFGFAECGVKGHPAVYTNVAAYIDWITEVIQKV